jgi:hypothetical protein
MFAGRTSVVMGRDPRCMRGIGCGCVSYSALRAAVDCLHPPDGFFDPLAGICADAIAGMVGRVRVDRGAAVGIGRRACGVQTRLGSRIFMAQAL